MTIKPMLAGSGDTVEETLKSLRYPLIASPKLDGIRGFVYQGKVLSRSLKVIPNRYIQERYGKLEYEGYDGEFIVGERTADDVFRKTSSVTSSHEKDIDKLKFYVFDYMSEPNKPFFHRHHSLQSDDWVHLIHGEFAENEYELMRFEEFAVMEGYEGLILRDPNGRYKYGRSTLNEGYLIKLKRFVDDEAVVIGFEEKMHNANEKTLVKNGKAARSSHAAGLVPLGTLGAIVVRWKGLEFNIGSGFTAEECDRVWQNREKYLGKLAKFKYFPIGMKDLPRHPVFLGFREGWDL